jgi:hypothetical protein
VPEVQLEEIVLGVDGLDGLWTPVRVDAVVEGSTNWSSLAPESWVSRYPPTLQPTER